MAISGHSPGQLRNCTMRSPSGFRCSRRRRTMRPSRTVTGRSSSGIFREASRNGVGTGVRRRTQRIASKSPVPDDPDRSVASHAGPQPVTEPRVRASARRHALVAFGSSVRCRADPRRGRLHDRPSRSGRGFGYGFRALRTRGSCPDFAQTTCAKTSPLARLMAVRTARDVRCVIWSGRGIPTPMTTSTKWILLICCGRR
jgi:hypothetical protein